MLGRCSRHSTYTLTERDLLAALKCERPDNTAVEIQGYSQHDRNAVCARTVSLSRRLAFRLPVAFWDLFGFCFLFSRQAVASCRSLLRVALPRCWIVTA